jgi:hypothetical protein
LTVSRDIRDAGEEFDAYKVGTALCRPGARRNPAMKEFSMLDQALAAAGE